MKLNKKDKQQLFQKYSTQKLAQDTGSSESQVALFTHKIRYLTNHLKTHTKDKASRLGLIKLISKRKRQLTYLQREGIERHRSLIASLKLRK